ncbi:hypothetical protein FOZ63_020946, partial [Perkinsus olseni]
MSQENLNRGSDNIIELAEFYDANPMPSVAEERAASAPENELSSVPTAKGGYYLLYHGYSFTRNDTSHNPANTHYWRCTAFTSSCKCRTRLTTLGDFRLGVDHLTVKKRGKPVPHSCSPSAKKKQMLFEMCKTIMDSPRESKIMDAYWKVAKEAREEDLLQLPRQETTYQWLRRFKKLHFGIPGAPKHRTGFEIPDEYRFVTFGDSAEAESQNALLWDSGIDDGHRIICYYNPWVLDHVYDNPRRAHLAMDGTYKVCPRNWVQQYTVRTYLQDGEGVLATPERWNMRERALAGFPRTNNSQEGFHHKWNTLFAAAVPPIIWTWIDVVLENMREVRTDLVLRNRGDRRRRRAYDQMKDVQLKALCNRGVDEATLPEWLQRARKITRKLTKNGAYPEHSRRRRTQEANT